MSLSPFHLFLLAAVTFIGAFLGTACIRRLARRYGWTAMPRQDRWHHQPTALHGGVGFCPPFFLAALWVFVWTSGAVRSGEALLGNVSSALPLAAALLVGSFVMCCAGLLDDLKPFRPVTKLLCQLVAASLFVYMGGVFPLTTTPVLNVLLTYFWFVGITNAVNMLDNMDGLASGVVILAGTTLVILALPSHGQTPEGVLAIPLGVAFVAALLGFWAHNRPPAAIFMGDSGSLCIGYTLAALAVPSPLNGYMGIRTGGAVVGPVLALLIPATVLAIPIFDTTLVTITRTWRAQKASQGGRDHSSHRLVGLGLSETNAVWLLYGLAGFGGMVAVLMQQYPDQSLPFFGFFGLTLVLTGVYLGHVKVQTTEPDRIPPAWTPLVANLLHKRHAAELLLDTVLVVTCFYGAHLLRFEGALWPAVTRAMVEALPLVVTSCLVAFFVCGLYRGLWRLISVTDVPYYAGGVVGGTVLSLATVTLFTRFSDGYSRSAYVIFAALLFLAMMGTRLSFRLLDALLLRRRPGEVPSEQQPVLIYGAGKAGKLLHEEVMFNPQMKIYTIVGFIDDDPNLAGRTLCGLPVKHGTAWIEQTWSYAPEIWISSGFVSDERAQQVAAQWPRGALLRRLRLHMEPISNLANDVPRNGIAYQRDIDQTR